MIDRREVNAPHGEARAPAQKEPADPVDPQGARRERTATKAPIKGVGEVRVHPGSATTVMHLVKAGVLARVVALVQKVRLVPPAPRGHHAPPDRKVHPEVMIGEGPPERMIEEDPLVGMIGEGLPEGKIGEDPQEAMIGGDPPEVMIGEGQPEATIREDPPVGMIAEGRPEDHVGMTAEDRMRRAQEDRRSLGKRRVGMNAPSAREIR